MIKLIILATNIYTVCTPMKYRIATVLGFWKVPVSGNFKTPLMLDMYHVSMLSNVLSYQGWEINDTSTTIYI